MKTTFKTLLIVLACSLSYNSFGQSYIDDAKNLEAFYELYHLNQDAVTRNNKQAAGTGNRIDLSTAIGRNNLAIAVANFMNSSGIISSTASNVDGAIDSGDDGLSISGTDQPIAADDSNGNATITNSPNVSEFISSPTADAANVNPQIANEIANYLLLVSHDLSSLLSVSPAIKMPGDFEYLAATVSVLKNDSSAQFTSGLGIGSIIGVSQSDILQGIAEWALKRAEQELMQSFLREWMQKIESDPILRQTFPNTLRMLSTSDLSSIVTDGATWKATFLQDFDNIPTNSPLIFKAVIQNSEIKLDSAVAREIEAGLAVMARLSKDIGLNKPADQIITLLGKQSFINAQSQPLANVATIDRTLIGAELLLSIIRKSEAQGKISYIKTSEITSLTGAEMRTLWKLIVLRNRSELSFLFNISGNDATNFYDKVSSDVSKLQLQIAAVAQSIESINTLIDDIAKSENQEFSQSQFSNYVTLIFDLVETSVDLVKTLGVDLPIFETVEKFSSDYLPGLKYITTIQQGISTKQYGIVALNTLNFIYWVRERIADGTTYSDASWNEISNVDELLKATSKFKPEKRETLKKVFDELEKRTQKQLAKYPDIASMLVSKFNALEQSLSATPNLTLQIVRSYVRSAFDFSASEQRVIAKDIATYKLANLQSTSEAINKYGKLMAAIILADDSEDIEKALESVANQSGGYMMRQKSYFSTTLSFYPGAAAGLESAKVAGQESTKGSFASVTLPIGIEMALGTNWKPIGAVGLFIQVLDLGAVLNYSLNNDNENLSSNPEIGFEQVLSPGGFITLHIANSPITLGLGAKYLPSLRTITTDQDVVMQANSLQVGAFLAVDLNVFTLSGSKKKFPLNSKSIKALYQND